MAKSKNSQAQIPTNANVVVDDSDTEFDTPVAELEVNPQQETSAPNLDNAQGSLKVDVAPNSQPQKVIYDEPEPADTDKEVQPDLGSSLANLDNNPITDVKVIKPADLNHDEMVDRFLDADQEQQDIVEDPQSVEVEDADGVDTQPQEDDQEQEQGECLNLKAVEVEDPEYVPLQAKEDLEEDAQDGSKSAIVVHGECKASYASNPPVAVNNKITGIILALSNIGFDLRTLRITSNDPIINNLEDLEMIQGLPRTTISLRLNGFLENFTGDISDFQDKLLEIASGTEKLIPYISPNSSCKKLGKVIKNAGGVVEAYENYLSAVSLPGDNTEEVTKSKDMICPLYDALLLGYDKTGTHIPVFIDLEIVGDSPLLEMTTHTSKNVGMFANALEEAVHPLLKPLVEMLHDMGSKGLAVNTADVWHTVNSPNGTDLALDYVFDFEIIEAKNGTKLNQVAHSLLEEKLYSSINTDALLASKVVTTTQDMQTIFGYGKCKALRLVITEAV